MLTVTGASGHLGRLVVEALLDSGVPAGGIIALARTPEKAADLTARGVQVRPADYTDPDSLRPALAGTDRLLLVSSSEVGQRVPQHQNVIRAAVDSGVGLIAYTSILNAATSSMQLAAEHQATEALIRDAGLPFTFLRNGWYLENYTENLAPALQFGAILGAAGDGVVAAAARADYAAAAAAVLAGEGHAGRSYELGGDQAFTLTQLAAEVSARSGTAVAYRDLTAEEYAKALIDAGLPAGYAEILANSDLGIARGELSTASRDLSRLIGRPTVTMAAAVAQALRS